MSEAGPPLPTTTASDSDRSLSPLIVLRHPHFRLIWFAAFGSYLGNWFEFVAVRWIVTEDAGNLAAQNVHAEDWMGYLSIAQLCPTLLLGLYGGIVADSVNRRSLLVATQFAMMLIAFAMAIVAFTGHANRWVLLGLVLAQGVAVPFNTPAWQVLTPRLVPKNELTLAITLNGISFNVARTVGPALAGFIMAIFKHPAAVAAVPAGLILVSTGDPGGSMPVASGGSSRGAAALLLFNAITFMGVMAAVLKTPDAPAPAELRGAWRNPGLAWSRSKQALAWVWTRKGPRAVLLAIVVFAILATPVMPLMSVVVREVHGGKEDMFGLFIAVMGLGAVTGGLAMKHVPRWYPMHHFIPLSCLLGGVFILLFGLADNQYWSQFLLFFVGVFWMWGFNSTAAAMQNLAEDDMRGRISAVVNTIAMGFMPLGPLIVSWSGHGLDALNRRIGEPFSAHPGLATQLGLSFTSLLLIGASLVMLIWRTPEVDNLKEGDHGFIRRPGLLAGILATSHRPRPAPPPSKPESAFEDAGK